MEPRRLVAALDGTDQQSGGMKVLVRLDDFTPNRHRKRWARVTELLDSLAIRPLVAVVPDDQYFGDAASDPVFWDEVRALESQGWIIGLHGATHEVVPIPKGVPHEIFFASKSEFVGLTGDAQLIKIAAAWEAFERHGIRPRVFVAPNHGFDALTVEAVRRHGKMPFISDGIALRPYSDRELVWLPQIDWKVPMLRVGFRTVCLHPSTMDDRELARITRQLRAVRADVVSFDALREGTARARGVADVSFKLVYEGFFRTRESLYELLSRLTRRGSRAAS
jgi:hypothetical protein